MQIMKKLFTFILMGVLIISLTTTTNAQDEKWSLGADLVSSYVWRGTKFGTGPALQPGISYNNGGFSIGGWGSYTFTDNEAGEADLFTSYGFDLSESSSVTFTLTDYFFPTETAEYFDGAEHYFEPMVSLSMGDLSLTAAYMTNQSGSQDVSDTYIEAGYSFGNVSIFAGAGNGQYTDDTDFDLCNVGITAGKEVKLTDSFSVPVSVSAILNPSTEKFNIVFCISL